MIWPILSSGSVVIFPVGPSRLLNDEIVNREIKEEPQWKQRRLREVTYHEQAEGLVPTKNTTNGDKQAFATRKAQVRIPTRLTHSLDTFISAAFAE